MQLTKNIITRWTALLVDSDYVHFIEGNNNKRKEVYEKFKKLKPKQQVITYHEGQYVAATISSINHSDMVTDPIVMVTNGEYSWRVDGDRYAVPV